MAKCIEELIQKGKLLEGMIKDPEDGDFYESLPEVEYAEWKSECATYLEKEYKANETTKVFLNEFNNALANDIDKYKKLLGYLQGMYNNEVDGIIKPKSKTKLVIIN